MYGRKLMLAPLAGLSAPMVEGGEGAANPGDKLADAQVKADAKKPKPKPKPKAAKTPKAGGKKKPKGTKGLTGPAVLKEYAPNYHKDKEKKTAGGNVSVDSNDKLAQKLRGMLLENVYAEAAKVLRDEDDKPFSITQLKAKYKHLNVGMQRMNLGNRIRAVLNAK